MQTAASDETQALASGGLLARRKIDMGSDKAAEMLGRVKMSQEARNGTAQVDDAAEGSNIDHITEWVTGVREFMEFLKKQLPFISAGFPELIKGGGFF